MQTRAILLSPMLGLLVLGCGQRSNNQAAMNGRPLIYDAWDARYAYQMENRSMVPVHQGRKVGRTWSRDVSGKINHSTYFSSNEEQSEDLFVLHSSQQDRKREKKWESSKEQRINFIKNQMDILKEEENAPLVEVLIEEEEEEFLPPTFIPQGIDLNSEEPPAEQESNQDMPPAFPFAPLP